MNYCLSNGAANSLLNTLSYNGFELEQEYNESILYWVYAALAKEV